MNLKKSEDSNIRRLESLRLQAEEFKQKKTQIRSSLHNLDSNNGKNGAVPNKKIIFSDDDEEDVPKNVQKKPFKKSLSTETESNVSQKKKQKLIDSDDDSDDSEAEKAKTIQMFENKINLNEKKANQLIQLKTKYSNEDSRFKIDDRFVDASSSSSEGSASESGSESESEKSGDSEAKEKKERKPKKLVSDESIKKKLKKETMASLDILASITGKTVRKPIDPGADCKKNDKVVKTQKMVRYDPTKDEHKIFELLSDDEEYESEINKLKGAKSQEKTAEDPNKLVDKTQYTKIESNIKDLFQSNDVFKFSFNNIAETLAKNPTDWEKPTKIIENKIQKHLNFNQFSKTTESSDSEDDDHVLEHLKKSEAPTLRNKLTDKSQSVNEIPRANLYHSSNPQKSLLPSFDGNKEIKDALSYFCCLKGADEIRKEWTVSREKLVEEYKKKHKRMLRIQKTKENEKVMTWRFKKKN